MKSARFKIPALVGASLLTAVLCAGCSKDARIAEENATVKRCWDTGGMPVRSIWDDRFIDCVYQENKGV